MNTLKKLATIPLVALCAALASGVHAQATAPADLSDLTDGEIRKVDKDTKKLTIKHGEIKNLDMPGMTMLFKVSDPAMLEAVQPGDKVRFRVEKAGAALVVTTLQVVK